MVRIMIRSKIHHFELSPPLMYFPIHWTAETTKIIIDVIGSFYISNDILESCCTLLIVF